jgi:cyclohexanone monooxygenase
MTLPMRQRHLTEAELAKQKREFPEQLEKRRKAFSGFDMSFLPKSASEDDDAERQETYRRLWDEGGLAFWLGNYNDLLINEKTNREAYEFWRDRTRERVADPTIARMLAPDDPPHPFGVKRPCLEQNYYEVFNRPNVTLVDIRNEPVDRVTATGLVTSKRTYELDILVLATGFDAVTGGLTAIDIQGTAGQSLDETWSDGVSTHLGMTCAAFPNLLFVYGPQSPSGFCNGPSCAELQGDWIVRFLGHCRENGIKRFEASDAAQKAWRDRSLRLASRTLFGAADSWYMGANIPGKIRELLIYPAGLPNYLAKCQQCADDGYSGFSLT